MTRIRHAFSFCARVSGWAAHGCRLLMDSTLRWPPEPAHPHWSLLHQDWLQEQAEANWTAAAPGVVVISRLVDLGLAMGLVLGEVNINIVRAPAVLGVPGGGSLAVSLPLTLALLFLAMAVFFGALALELWGVTPYNLRLFPALRPGVRRVLRVIAFSGFVASVVTVGLMYAIGAALLQGITSPPLTILINVLQGVLLTIIAVPAILAIVLGLMALVTLVCALLWVALTGLSLVFQLVAGEGPYAPDEETGDSSSPTVQYARDPGDAADWSGWM